MTSRMIDIHRNLHMQIQELQQQLESIKSRLFLLEATDGGEQCNAELLDRRLTWLENEYQEQQMQIDNIMRRISNDLPVAPWGDD